MSMQDPIADMLTRIRNAGMASLKELALPSSKLKTGIAFVMKEEGYIKDFRVEGEGPIKNLVVELKYYRKEPVIEGLERVSKPSCRIYCSATEIPRVRNGLGTVILSTSKGILSGTKATAETIGGEVLCYVW